MAIIFIPVISYILKLETEMNYERYHQLDPSDYWYCIYQNIEKLVHRNKYLSQI